MVLISGGIDMKNNKSIVFRAAVLILAAVIVVGFIIMPFIR